MLDIFRQLCYSGVWHVFEFCCWDCLKLTLIHSYLSLFRVCLGTSWGVLGRSWGVLGWSWGLLERSWGLLGRSWGGLGASWVEKWPWLEQEHDFGSSQGELLVTLAKNGCSFPSRFGVVSMPVLKKWPRRVIPRILPDSP